MCNTSGSARIDQSAYRKTSAISRKTLIVPAGVAELVNDDPLRDGLLKLAAWLYERTACIDAFRDGALIPLSRKTLRSLLSGRYSKYTKAAEKLKLVERHHSYQEDLFPKSARLHEQYRGGEWEAVELRWARHADATTARSTDPVCNWLGESLGAFGLASQFASDDPWAQYAARAIQVGDWSLFRDEFGWRVHSNYTRAALTIRRSILMPHNSITTNPVTDSLCLYELDIRNCQPLLIGWLAGEWWKSQGRTVPSDVLRWVEVCQSGQLYEDLADKCNLLRNSTEYDREWVKQRMMTAHYAEQRVVDCCFLAQVEQRYYPSIYEFLGWLRCQPIDGEPKALWFRSTSQRAQRLESKLIIDTACRLIMARYPDAHIITIHDAIIAAKRWVSVVKDAILEAFDSIGLTPAIKPPQLLSEIPPKPQPSPQERAARSRRLVKKRIRNSVLRGKT